MNPLLLLETHHTGPEMEIKHRGKSERTLEINTIRNELDRTNTDKWLLLNNWLQILLKFMESWIDHILGIGRWLSLVYKYEDRNLDFQTQTPYSMPVPHGEKDRAETGWSLSSRPPDLQIKFQDSQNDTEKLYLEKQANEQTKRKVVSLCKDFLSPLPQKCWSYRHLPPHPVKLIFKSTNRGNYYQGKNW